MNNNLSRPIQIGNLYRLRSFEEVIALNYSESNLDFSNTRSSLEFYFDVICKNISDTIFVLDVTTLDDSYIDVRILTGQGRKGSVEFPTIQLFNLLFLCLMESGKVNE